MLTTTGCSGGGVNLENPITPPIDEKPSSPPTFRAPDIEPIDPSNPIPLYFVHKSPKWMSTDKFNNNPLIPQIPVKLTCILAGFQAGEFSGKIKAHLDTEEINAYFDPITKEVTVGFGSLKVGRHYLSIRTVGHPGFWGAKSYEFEVVDEPPDFTVGWENEYNLIVEFAKPLPHWKMESPNTYRLTGADNGITKIDAFISNQIFRITLDSPLTHPKDIDPSNLTEDIKVTYNGLLGYKEGILIKAKSKSGDSAPRQGQWGGAR